jgi:two-component system sensor kinase FixL
VKQVIEAIPPGGLADELQLFIESATDRALFLLSPDGAVISWTVGSKLLTGWSRDEIIGRPADLLYTASDRAADRPRRDREAAMAAGVVRGECWRIRKDGSEFAADATIVALRDEAGALRGFGQNVYDITQRKAAEQARIHSELHMRSILASVKDAMVVIDARGRILSFSAAAERLFGYAKADVVGVNVSVLMPAPDRDRHDDYLAHYAATGERRIIGIGRVVTGQKRDGTVFPMELSVGEADDGAQRIFTGFIRDLSEKQRAEQALKELQSELIHVSRVSAMGAMASTLAHELNQPLSAIANYLEAARDMLAAPDDADPALLREAVEEGAREALRAGQIVRRLREFVSRRTVDRRPQPLPPIIEEARRLALVGAAERGVRTFVALDPTADEVLADKVQVQQVLVNLIRNAIEALADRDVREITIATRRTGATTTISVGDTGPGIDAAVAARLFEAFATSKTDGMGLGLSICRTIVEAHGGRIWAEPRAGGGTVFSFTLPALPGDAASGGPADG